MVLTKRGAGHVSRVGAGQARARRDGHTSPTKRMWGSLLSAVLLAVAACDRQALALSTHRRTTCVSGSRAAAILRPTSSDEHGESQLARPTRSSLATMKGGAEAPSVILPLSGCILLSLISE